MDSSSAARSLAAKGGRENEKTPDPPDDTDRI
jgi:hypothetical protein